MTVPLRKKVPLEGDCRTPCSCSTLPELTCGRYRSCDLAAQRGIGCHDIACQVGCEVHLNVMSATARTWRVLLLDALRYTTTRLQEHSPETESCHWLPLLPLRLLSHEELHHGPPALPE